MLPLSTLFNKNSNNWMTKFNFGISSQKDKMYTKITKSGNFMDKLVQLQSQDSTVLLFLTYLDGPNRKYNKKQENSGFTLN